MFLYVFAFFVKLETSASLAVNGFLDSKIDATNLLSPVEKSIIGAEKEGASKLADVAVNKANAEPTSNKETTTSTSTPAIKLPNLAPLSMNTTLKQDVNLKPPPVPTKKKKDSATN